jgi:prepilin-type N-terminal cleavage/methylation domain-containing protein
MKKTAFTLIELIVVITILAILWTIAFISFNGYSWQTRNAKITTDLSNMHNALSLYKAEKWLVPMPDSSIKVEAWSWNTITYEWEIWDTVRSLTKADNNMISPDNRNYKYATNWIQKRFILIWEIQETSAYLSNAYAKSNEKVFKWDEVLTLFNSDWDFIPGDINNAGWIPNLNKVFLWNNELEIAWRNINWIPPEIKENKTYRKINYIAKYYLSKISWGKLHDGIENKYEWTVMNGLSWTSFTASSKHYVNLNSIAPRLNWERDFTLWVKFKWNTIGSWEPHANVFISFNTDGSYDNVLRYNISPKAWKLWILWVDNPKINTATNQEDVFLDKIIWDWKYHTIIWTINQKTGRVVTYLDWIEVANDPFNKKYLSKITKVSIWWEYDWVNMSDNFTWNIDRVFLLMEFWIKTMLNHYIFT